MQSKPNKKEHNEMKEERKQSNKTEKQMRRDAKKEAKKVKAEQAQKEWDSKTPKEKAIITTIGVVIVLSFIILAISLPSGSDSETSTKNQDTEKPAVELVNEPVLDKCSGESPIPLKKVEVVNEAAANAEGAKTIIFHYDGDISQGEVSAGANAYSDGIYQRDILLQDGEEVHNTLWIEKEKKSEEIIFQPQPENGTLELVVPATWAESFSKITGSWLRVGEKTSECSA